MSVASPQWLWLLALPVILLVLHMLRHPARRLIVSSTLLWHGIARPSQRLARARPSLRAVSTSLVLSLLILTALALAAPGPWRVHSTPPPAFAVVLDCSPSMGARLAPDGPRRIDLARDTTLALLRSESAAPFRLLLLAGSRVEMFSAGAGDQSPFEKALRDLTPSTGAGTLARTVAAAAAVVLAHGGGRVAIVSDFAGADASLLEGNDNAVTLDAIAVGGPLENTAITSLFASPRPGAERAVDVAATVLNASDASIDVGLTASLNGTSRLQQSFNLSAGEKISWCFPIESSGSDLLEVRASPGGALDTDDALRIRLPAIGSMRAQAPDSLPATVRAALEALEGGASTPPLKGEPVFLFQDEIPENPPSRWIFLAAKPASVVVKHRAAPPVILEPLTLGQRFLEPIDRITLDADVLPPIPPPQGAVPIALAGGRVAIALVDGPQSRGVWWGIPVEATSLAGHGRFPLVLARMREWLGSSHGPVGSVTSPLTDPDLEPRPSIAVRDAAAVLRDTRRQSTPLRMVFLWGALLLTLIQGARRWLEK